MGSVNSLMTCINSSCGRKPWNGDSGHCCRDCKDTHGLAHDDFCDAKHNSLSPKPQPKPQPKSDYLGNWPGK